MVKSLADCFKALWDLAIDELSEASGTKGPTVGIVEYEVASALPGERASYRWNDGSPSIRLFVESPAPAPSQPDLSRAQVDLFTLAHELGHFAVDRKCEVTTAARDRLASGKGTGSDALSVLSEEREAWDAAQTFLSRVECLDVESLRRVRDAALATYTAGLRPLLPRHEGSAASAQSDTTPRATERYFERVRATAPEARLKRAFELSDRVREATMADVERRMPNASRAELEVAFMRRVYGDQIAARFAARRAR